MILLREKRPNAILAPEPIISLDGSERVGGIDVHPFGPVRRIQVHGPMASCCQLTTDGSLAGSGHAGDQDALSAACGAGRRAVALAHQWLDPACVHWLQSSGTGLAMRPRSRPRSALLLQREDQGGETSLLDELGGFLDAVPDHVALEALRPHLEPPDHVEPVGGDRDELEMGLLPLPVLELP